MKTIMFFRCFLVMLCAAACQQAAAQQPADPHLLPGPDGMVIYTYPIFKTEQRANGPALPPTGQEVIIYRQTGNADYRKLTTVHFPKNAGELSARLNEEAKRSLMEGLKVQSMEEAYQLIVRHGTDTLGFLMFIPELQEAFGFFYRDVTWKPGERVSYRFDRVTGGQIEEAVYTESSDGKPIVYNTRFRLVESEISGDNAQATWGATRGSDNPETHFAQLFVREGPTGAFKPLNKTIIFSEASDSVFVRFHRPVTQDKHLAWFIRPFDIAGNYGPASDTMNAIAIDETQITAIQRLKAQDTLGGIRLTWEKLPGKGYYSGIEVLKSLSVDTGYFSMDTLAINTAEYLDKKVIPGTMYYYKVRPLTIDYGRMKPQLYSETSGYKDFDVQPEMPAGLTAYAENGRVLLQWLPNTELNLFGYYILRGTSRQNLSVIAGPVKDYSFIDSTISPKHNGRYVYALQLMDNGQNMSDTSEAISVNVMQPVVLTSPGGITGERLREGVRLQWDNTRNMDNTIIGYMLYRRTNETDRFAPVNTVPLPMPAFIDTTADRLTAYQYAVSSIDLYGNQSILSSVAGVDADVHRELSPPVQFSVRNTTRGIEVSWPVPARAENKQYVIYRKAANDHAYQKVGTADPLGVFVDARVAKDQLYRYAIAVSQGDREGRRSKDQMIRKR